MKIRNLAYLASTLLLAGCFETTTPPPPDAGFQQPIPGGGGGGGGRNGVVSGTLTLFQGAQSASSGAAKLSEEKRRAAKRLLAALAGRRERIADPGVALSRAPGTAWSALPASGRVIIPGELIVRVDEVLQPAEVVRLARVDGLNAEHVAYVTDRLHLLKFSNPEGGQLSSDQTDGLARTLTGRDRIRFAEPNVYQFAMAVPNDTYYAYQMAGGVLLPELQRRVLPGGVDMLRLRKRSVRVPRRLQRTGHRTEHLPGVLRL